MLSFRSIFKVTVGSHKTRLRIFHRFHLLLIISDLAEFKFHLLFFFYFFQFNLFITYNNNTIKFLVFETIQSFCFSILQHDWVTLKVLLPISKSRTQHEALFLPQYFHYLFQFPLECKYFFILASKYLLSKCTILLSVVYFFSDQLCEVNTFLFCMLIVDSSPWLIHL